MCNQNSGIPSKCTVNWMCLLVIFCVFSSLNSGNYVIKTIRKRRKQEQQKKAEKKEPKISSNKVSDPNCLCQVACCAL